MENFQKAYFEIVDCFSYKKILLLNLELLYLIIYITAYVLTCVWIEMHVMFQLSIEYLQYQYKYLLKKENVTQWTIVANR